MSNEQIYRITVPTPFAVGDVNMYLIKGETLTLVDAGVKTEEAWQMFQHQLRQLGFTPSDIEQVVLTHHHPDHVGLLDYFPSSLHVVGHIKGERWLSKAPEFLEKDQQFFEQFLKECGVENAFLAQLSEMRSSLRYSCRRSLSATIQEGDAISGLSGWTVIETPGHAQSHIVLYREQDGLMIGGDHLLLAISSNPLLEPPFNGETERPKPLLQYNRSLRKLFDYHISRIVTGHGDDVTEVKELVEKRLNKQRERAYQVLDMLKARPLSAFDVCKQLFPAVYEREFILTMSETIGQLDYLEDIGKVVKRKVGEHYVYEAK
ncbi:glyoxylase-like metal-dependent hydrolase (beta-lactamase superfamily II) [Anoxybacillus vitaminiphilus]|uniref:Glyoxylase-like metal-dependent hydrolase (Beta-lactamase superfamily II) n=1 Tax=Paranoxybacillus vitaminiphilus TaxID=581036 RepID=A0A327YPU1_9BACL|nr:MBL fold metallo-hydrolase [Anoxybacillus vitaminiphilus]RAK22267.1 glyoxylase-like metal-dependent hydrolase (beta-lactamase superfamily II) [Anoxybacillus vitaminiphilus]